MRSFSALRFAAVFAVGGSVLAVAVPAFYRNLSASKLTEPIEGLDRMVRGAVAYAARHPQEISFPPSAPLTPAEVPRALRVIDPPDAWKHLTWLSLDFGFDPCARTQLSCGTPHAFSFKFDSEIDPTTQVMRFVATAHGDLDGDGVLSTFEVRGERAPGQPARVLPGMFIDREVE
ncbi:Hypothetical protein A7982_03795 [Minicystis rosea]|nr:Hypothetical protein A7982_03795 [Minicystis rosea]